MFRKTNNRRGGAYNLINYRPYLRLSRKFWRRGLTSVVSITQELLSDQTVFISNDFKRCAAVKERLGSDILVVYDMYDRYSEYGNEYYTKKTADIAQFDEQEEKAIAGCDLVLCASQALLAEALRNNSSSLWFPNAVSHRSIACPASRKTGKILGVLSDRMSRFNPQALIELAQTLPDYKIELIGKNDFRLPRGYPANMVFKNYMPHSELLEYIGRWDCGLSLYQADRFNYYCCPLKYFEYSSQNLPIITASIPEGKVYAELYPQIVYLADDIQSIARQIKEIEEKRPAIDFTRLACENTWQLRARQLTAVLTKLFAERQ